MNEFQRLQDTRSIYKNQLCFYIVAINKLKTKLRKITPLTITSKRIMYLEITLTKVGKLQNTPWVNSLSLLPLN